MESVATFLSIDADQLSIPDEEADADIFLIQGQV